MRLTSARLDDYVADLAELAERYGVALDLAEGESLIVEMDPSGSRRFMLSGTLPAGRRSPSASVELAETWRPAGPDGYERSAYRYELLERERDFRRAFHRHDEELFALRYGVVVHEHCEAPIGAAPCAHLFGAPVRDGYRAIELLMSAWVADPPDCGSLPCLDPI
ncbi:MAG: hypothetical protein ACXWXV_11575 [Aeromicrobium sp.]